jgi:HEAT repeat protein
MHKLTRSEQIRAKRLRNGNRAKGREERLDRGEVDDLLRLTYDPNAEVRNAAAQALCPCHVQANIDKVWDRLIAMAEDPDVDVRATILHTLCDGSPRTREGEVVQALETMYNDPDQKLRRRVRKLLAQYRRQGKINVL